MDLFAPHQPAVINKNVPVWIDAILVEANILNIYYFSDVVACISNSLAQNLDF